MLARFLSLAVTRKDAYVAEIPARDESQQQVSKLDTSVPQTARIWNYWLGGKDNFAVDREMGDRVQAIFPEIVENARTSRAYLARAVRFLVREAGIRQFLDVGTGLPTAENTHEIAQSMAPECRIVYVDNDPLVLVHARALLTSHPDGVTDYIDADMRDTARVLREASRTLDFTKPVALMMMGILGHIGDDDEARSIISGLMAAMPSGSYLATYDGTDISQDVVDAMAVWNQSANPQYHLRSPERIARLFDGLELVEPGLVSVTRWRPDPDQADVPPNIQFCAVGRKP